MTKPSGPPETAKGRKGWKQKSNGKPDKWATSLSPSYQRLHNEQPCERRFLGSQTVNPFPAPATSHPSCGFPALGTPVCLVSRVMWPIVLGRLSHLTIDGAGSC